jgi:hypothetical protein
VAGGTANHARRAATLFGSGNHDGADDARGLRPGVAADRLLRLLPDPTRAHEPGSVTEDYARIFGGSGRTGPIASKNCAVVACQTSMQRWPPVHRRGSGACPDTRRSNKPCATTISPHSVSRDSMSLPQLNPVEPPWYGPVCPVVGEGWHREMSPYPDPGANSVERDTHWYRQHRAEK